MTNNEAIIVLKNIAWLGTDAERQQIEEAVEMAINALKAQELANNSPELDNNFGDLISRAAAIDAMPQRIEGCGGESWMMTYRRSGHNDCVDVCLNAIRNLPSVQPEQSSEIQDILDYLDAVLHPIISPENWNVYSELHDMISTLPSAQPETHEERTETHGVCLDAISRQDVIDAMGKVQWAKVRLMELPSAQPEWNNHTVACLLADLFDDTCACNYNGIDEWLPEKCEVIDSCPNPVGVACWEQFLKHRAERRTDD